MTDRKHFKHLVRERMRRTGERYTVARRHVAESAPGWELRGGVHGDTAAFANVLANLGVEAAGGPLTEAMVLGVGGGLGAGYILWEFEAHAARSRELTLGFQRQWQYPARWAGELATRLGLHAEIHETGGTKRAAATLDAQLDRGLPAIAWIDTYTLGLRGEPAWRAGYGGAPVVVYERAGDTYAIDACSRARETVPADVLAAARGRVVSYKNRLITIDPELVDLSDERLRDAVEEGLRLQVEHLSASSSSFSLPAWRKWARMTTDTRAAKGWPTVFADGRGVASAMASIYTGASGGAHLRGLYATVLDDAADLLSRPGLRDAAAAWREAAAAWDVIVDTALPPGDDLRALIDAGDDEARWALQAQRDLAADLPALAAPVQAMYEAEVAALRSLESAAAPGR
jgi:hypothetical protein